MTDCCNQLNFSFYHHKRLVADFKGGSISSDSGLLLVRELADRLGWLTQVTEVLWDDRHPDRLTHDLLAVVRQRIFGIVGGYEDCNDHDRLRHDPVFKLLADRAPQDDPLV